MGRIVVSLIDNLCFRAVLRKIFDACVIFCSTAIALLQWKMQKSGTSVFGSMPIFYGKNSCTSRKKISRIKNGNFRRKVQGETGYWIEIVSRERYSFCFRRCALVWAAC